MPVRPLAGIGQSTAVDASTETGGAGSATAPHTCEQPLAGTGQSTVGADQIPLTPTGALPDQLKGGDTNVIHIPY